jgi:hypothetical protein
LDWKRKVHGHMKSPWRYWHYTKVRYYKFLDLFEGFVYQKEDLVEITYHKACLMWPSNGTVKYGHIRQVVARYRFIIPPLIEWELYCNHLFRSSVRLHFCNRYLSFYWKKWFYIW